MEKHLKAHGSLTEDTVKGLIRHQLKDIKYQQKKYKEETVRLFYKYDHIKEKMKDQNRLLEKIRANSHRSHKSRSTSKVREMEYLSKNGFSTFLNELH